VVSHLKLAASPDQVGAPRVAAGAARLILGCDMVVTASKPVLATARAGVTRAIVNAERTFPGDVARKGDMAFPEAALRQRIERALGDPPPEVVEASRLAARLVGDSIGANLMMVGYAWQKGLIPLSRASIERAIELNGVQVEMNRQAFLWGRRAAVDPEAVRAIAGERPAAPAPFDLDQLIGHRVALLTAYQDRAWAERYRAVVERVRRVEAERVPGSTALTEAVARNLARLMSYKDEYEVARLYTDGSFARALGEQFEGELKLTFHLAPPLLADRDPLTGVPKKRRFGPWMLTALGWLARLKWLRGTAFDPFGRTAERRTERALIGDYEALLDELLAGLRGDRLEQALELARLPEQIRGFGHIKERNLAQARARWQTLLEDWRRGAPAEALRAAE
jgi:indolepyruvate ferredoxin oxidoreductase